MFALVCNSIYILKVYPLTHPNNVVVSLRPLSNRTTKRAQAVFFISRAEFAMVKYPFIFIS